jgi:hypothetical protein
MPWAFYHLPVEKRLHMVKKYLGPAGGWFMKDRIAPVPTVLGYETERATVVGDKVHLQLRGMDGSTRLVASEHVIAATGYRVDMRRLSFISPALCTQLKTIEETPVLSQNFETSVPGLYVVGPAAANSFGPLMRFAVGAGFTAKRITKHLAADAHAPSRPRPQPVLSDLQIQPNR